MPQPTFPIDVFILGRPISANVTGLRRTKWKARVLQHALAQNALGGAITATAGLVVFSIGNYHGPGTVVDADNAIKIAQDALNQVVYHDDRQVTDSMGYKRDIATVVVTDASVVPWVQAGQPFVHVRVSSKTQPHLACP
jgi:hypothetical protein